MIVAAGADVPLAWGPMENTGSLKSDCVRLAILEAVALALGTYLIATTVLISPDGVFYIEEAQRIPRGISTVAERYPLGYPLLLFAGHAAVRLLARDDSVMIWLYSSQATTLFCRAAALIVLYLAGRRLVGSRHSFLGVMILTLLPYGAHYGSDVLREWPFLLLVAVGFWLILCGIQERKWWVFGGVGLATGVGYLIQPASGQVAIYGLTALLATEHTRGWLGRSAGGALLLAAGFGIPVLPCIMATGRVTPHQLERPRQNRPPVILSVGGTIAGDEPIRLVVRQEQDVEIRVEAFDPEQRDLEFSAVAVPTGSRPVYRLLGGPEKVPFWTISEEEKNLLLTTYPTTTWNYDAIAFYAYVDGGDAPNLCPVYRLWSPGDSGHLYTSDRAVRDTLLADSSAERWQNEGIAFYVFGERDRLPDAIPIQQFDSATQAHSRAVELSEGEHDDSRSAYDGIVWYAHGGNPPPAGFAFRDGAVRWRPSSRQVGRHHLNLIVSDRQSASCQILQIDVRQVGANDIAGHDGSPSPRQDPAARVDPSISHRVASLEATSGSSAREGDPEKERPAVAKPASLVRRSAEAVACIVWGLAENLMLFFLLPLGVGLYHRWRHEASRCERCLIISVLVVNMGLMFVRYVWIAREFDRRYCLTAVALTAFHIPIGLDRVAQWLARRGQWLFPGGHRPRWTERFWLRILVAIGLVACIPLLRPLGAGRGNYRLLAQWLQENTPADAIIAVPDSRIAFYAGRRGRVYRDEVYSPDADHVVVIVTDNGAEDAPGPWHRLYALPVQTGSDHKFVVYRRPAR